MSIPRHRAFISYHHANDQRYKDQLVNMTYFDYVRYQYVSVFDWTIVKQIDTISQSNALKFV